MHLVFLDTEFIDFKDPQLISIGLASIRGHLLYDEVDYPTESCSSFVRKVVIPLLSSPQRISREHLRTKILMWLDEIRNAEPILICYDSDYDRTLLLGILDNRPPSFLIFRRIGYNCVNGLRRQEFFLTNGLVEHHALNDAMALRYAFRGWGRSVR